MSQGREADARDGHGKDEHQCRSHDAEEDGHGCEDGGQGFSMTFHGPTMAPGRATLAGTEYGGATWAPGAGNGVRAYDARVRTRACLIVVALLVAGCGGGASGPIASSAPASPAAGASATPGTPSSVQTTTAPTPSSEPPTPGPTVSGPLALASSAFEDGGAIPPRFTCDGRDISPPLAWTNVPDGTVSFLIHDA